MVREELYNRTTDILFQAYFNGTLRHGDCAACAVGNILKPAADAMGVRNGVWNALFMTITDGNDQILPQLVAPGDAMIIPVFHEVARLCECNTDLLRKHESAQKLIAASGYTVNELAAIEYAFESADKGLNDEDYMFNGLVAVLEVLDQIHEVNTEVSQISKSRFSRHYETLIAN